MKCFRMFYLSVLILKGIQWMKCMHYIAKTICMYYYIDINITFLSNLSIITVINMYACAEVILWFILIYLNVCIDVWDSYSQCNLHRNHTVIIEIDQNALSFDMVNLIYIHSPTMLSILTLQCVSYYFSFVWNYYSQQQLIQIRNVWQISHRS